MAVSEAFDVYAQDKRSSTTKRAGEIIALQQLLGKRGLTQLCVGPMSKNCVDAVINLANRHNTLMTLIASRRQIDSGEFGGGYVNNWTTTEFCKYVTARSNGKILLARDHGGPWQSNLECSKNLAVEEAMASAKSSFMADIDSGMHMLHIDPSIDIHQRPSIDVILDRAFELYEFCWDYAQLQGKEVGFEIGTEEQCAFANSIDDLDYMLSQISFFCVKNRLPKPTFVVVQTGTRVMEMQNVGTFEACSRSADEARNSMKINSLLKLCRKHRIFLKQHNTDFLSDRSLKRHPSLGIHAANVAPEFGIAETRALLSLMEHQKLVRVSEKFLEIAYESFRWEKWMLPDSKSNDRDRAIIAGHYVFSKPEVKQLKAELASSLKPRIQLDSFLTKQVEKSISRYCRAFGLHKT